MVRDEMHGNDLILFHEIRPNLGVLDVLSLKRVEQQPGVFAISVFVIEQPGHHLRSGVKDIPLPVTSYILVASGVKHVSKALDLRRGSVVAPHIILDVVGGEDQLFLQPLHHFDPRKFRFKLLAEFAEQHPVKCAWWGPFVCVSPALVAFFKDAFGILPRGHEVELDSGSLEFIRCQATLDISRDVHHVGHLLFRGYLEEDIRPQARVEVDVQMSSLWRFSSKPVQLGFLNGL